MNLSDDLIEKIEKNLSDNTPIKKQLLSGNADAIRTIGILSQEKIDPNEVIEAYENDDMKYIYLKAKKLKLLNEIYEDLNTEYYKNIKETQK